LRPGEEPATVPFGIIAENHLRPKAKDAVTTLLNGQTLSDVASWADDTRDRTTAPWHFINVQQGLSYDEFSKEVAAKEYAYTVLQAQEAYIVHFVGDIHSMCSRHFYLQTGCYHNPTYL
jgi:lysozyme family protein